MSLSLKILGCSSATPTPDRYSTAQVLNVLERFFLIDCGEGAQINMRRYKINMLRINHIFISHVHGDHFLGLPGVLSSMNMQGRTSDLHIYSHEKLHTLINAFIDTFDAPLGYNIIYHKLSGDNGLSLIYEDDKVTVHSFPLRHRIPTCGFLFREKPKLRHLNGEMAKELNIPIYKRINIKQGEDFTDADGIVHPNSELTTEPDHSCSYAFMSDTVKLTKAIPWIEGVDLLYHEATYGEDNKKRARDNHHSTAKQAAEIAAAAHVGKLVIGHYSNRYKDLQPLLDEARTVFAETYTAKDGATFEVKDTAVEGGI